MKIFKTSQIKDLDLLTIEAQQITSYELMKRAVYRLYNTMLPQIEKNQRFVIVAGPGNNGGDALVLSKLLLISGLHVEAFLFHKGKLSEDCLKAKKEAEEAGLLISENTFNIELTPDTILIDGLFGAGLSRPIEGLFSEVVTLINNSQSTVWSIDIPSGLFGEDNSQNYNNPIVKATQTFTFQQPKIAFMLAENEDYVGTLSVIDIGLDPLAIEQTPSNYFYIESKLINLKKRKRFSHKGTFGHALLVAGKYGMAGAALLACKSAMRMGVGLLTSHIPSRLYDILQISVPEVIIDLDINESYCSSIDNNKVYSAIGIGPGLGTLDCTAQALYKLLSEEELPPLVIDADALNILSQHIDWLNKLPENTIITPHPKEFDRIAGKSKSSYERLEKGIQTATQYKIIVIIKGANTSVILPNGEVYFNCTGNSGMASAGSGDVLTGIILSLLAQHYPAPEAAIYGVYLHGLAGDLAASEITEEALIASDLITYLPNAIKEVKNYK